MAALREVRLAVGTPTGRRSTVWKFWVQKSEIYILSRMFGSDTKVMGIDPANERAVAVAGATQTFDPIIDGYIAVLKDAVETGARTQKHYLTTMRFLKNYFKPLHGLAVTSIERHHVATQLNVIRREHGPVAMNRARGGLSSFFNWAIGEGICKYNPVDKTNKSEEQPSRRR
jgi:hypothetical protein